MRCTIPPTVVNKCKRLNYSKWEKHEKSIGKQIFQFFHVLVLQFNPYQTVTLGKMDSGSLKVRTGRLIEEETIEKPATGL